ncbi:acyl-CoA dehydrogenase family protein [Bradyrhizobium sp. CNPSo 4019]|uniref:Acyl-CoA dehydrogenase family protein n=1 Tax=Bradyrhizobium diversitatis TaxID=2755406 RepID=A0ABS0NZD3_9BRAD|nr:acyl-CoA dehydrogenase family protein [Bradyrhizobium diversitatis]
MLTETQAAIRDEVRKFARESVAPYARDYEEAKQYPSRLFEELASLGLMGMMAPESVGGAGADYVSYALSLIEIAAAVEGGAEGSEAGDKVVAIGPLGLHSRRSRFVRTRAGHSSLALLITRSRDPA